MNPEDFLLGVDLEKRLDNGEINKNQTLWYDRTKGDGTHSWIPKYYVDQFNHYLGTLYKCLTVDVPYVQNKTFNKLAIVMKKSVFLNSIRPVSLSTGGLFSVQIGFPQQRLRYSSKRTSWTAIQLNESYGTVFDVHGLEVVKRRNKRSEPCNTDWKQDDMIIRDG